MKRISIWLAVVMILTSVMTFCAGKNEVAAKTSDFTTSALKDSELKIYDQDDVFYTFPEDAQNSESWSVPFSVVINLKSDKYSSYLAKYGEQLWKKYESVSTKIEDSLKYTSSNPDVAAFVSYKDGKSSYSKNFQAKKGNSVPKMVALKEGSTTITIYSKLLKQSITCELTVRDAEITCDESKYYTGNTYQFSLKSYEDYLEAVSYSSSNEKVAKVLSDGSVKAKKAGTATISCKAENGKTYKKTIKVEKAGLNYTKLTTYYFEDHKEEFNPHQPLIAKGITVKKWSSSDNKIATVDKLGDHLGNVKIKNFGKVKITATATNGKKYTCQLTITGGKKWSGLNGGYRPTVATIKKHGYYKDINKIQDYGDVIYYIADSRQEINYNNGNKAIDEIDKEALEILTKRYPDKTIKLAVKESFLGVDGGANKYGALMIGCYYVED